MTRIILYLIANILIVLGLSQLLPNFEVSSAWAAGVFLLVLAVLHFTIIPVLKILTLPINFLSLGLVGFLINLLSIWFVASNIQGIQLTGGFSTQFITLILISIGLSLGKGVIDKILGNDQQTQADYRN